MPIAGVVVAVDIAVGVVVTQGPLPVEAPFRKPGVARAPVIRRRQRKTGLGLSARRKPEPRRSHHRRSYDDRFRSHAALDSQHDQAVTSPVSRRGQTGAGGTIGVIVSL
jgi:hypothetical protein